MTAPLLTVCIPAYNRPVTIVDNLRAVTALPSRLQHTVEVVVTDDSDDDSVERVVRRELQGWEGPWSYVRNQRRLGMAGNWNAAIGTAAGNAIVGVHDDDCLVTAGIPHVLRVLSGPHPEVMLFGVKLVDVDGRSTRIQRRSRRAQLTPAEAVRRLLSNSSFVRFPAMVVSRQAYSEEGLFDEHLGGVADLDMWIRLCSRHGLTIDPTLFAAYRVHDDSLTTGMWHPGTLDALAAISHSVPITVIPRCQSRLLLGRFYSQFLLAGAVRRLRCGDHDGALRILDLFDEGSVSGVAVPRYRRLARHLMSAVARAGLALPSTRSRPATQP